MSLRTRSTDRTPRSTSLVPESLEKDLSENPSKRLKTVDTPSYLHKTLQESGLILKNPPDRCVATQEIILIINNISKNLQKHFDYPYNLNEFYSDLERDCVDLNVFKHYLFPSILKVSEDSPEKHPVNVSVFKILLSIPILQNKLIDFVFKKAVELAILSKCGPWIQIILRCMSSLDSIVDTAKVSNKLINLLDMATENSVRLEIIAAIPDIIGDQEHSNIADKLSRVMSEDRDSVPAILDCLSYLCLSDDQYEQLQKNTLEILTGLTRCTHFSHFIKFLLVPGRRADNAYLETVQTLRNCIGWASTLETPQDIASSQVVTAAQIRNSMIASKVISNAWLKAVSSCKISNDHKPIDLIILLILYSTSEEKQKQVENVIRKHIKLNILKEELLDEAFEKFKPILKNYLKTLISLTNSLLKTRNDPLVETFASHIYTLMLSELEDCCQTIVAELLQVGLDCKQSVMNILRILNNVASKNMSLLKPQSVQMLILLDRMDDMSLDEIRAVMNLVCGLAYSVENSVIRDDIHMIIRKELSSSSPKIKIQGILAGIHAVKYLMAMDSNNDNTIDLPDDVSYSSDLHLPEGDLREAAQIIELISRSTRQFPDMIAFFYDELSKVISTAPHINKHFLSWLTDAVTNDLQQNFIVDIIETEKIGKLQLSMQYCLNAESEVNETIAINIAGLALQSSEVVVGILSPLFQLVQTLHCKQHNNNLSNIDALLGCPVVMPNFNIDDVEDMDHVAVNNILDCLVYCINWFRELVNAFAAQNDEQLKSKILKRVLQIEELERVIGQILLTSKISYKPPICTFNINKYTKDQAERKTSKSQTTKQKIQKKTILDETALPDTVKTQTTQNNNLAKNKVDIVHNIPFRPLSLNLLELLNSDIGNETDLEDGLNIQTLKFLLRCINNSLQKVLVAKIKRKTFLSKPDDCGIYDSKKAEECANSVNKILPKIKNHLEYVTSYIESHTTGNSQNESGIIFTSEMMDYLLCLEYIYNMLTIYFKWIGFKNHHIAILKSSLRTIATTKEANVALQDLCLNVVMHLQKHEAYCLQLSTAVSLIEFLMSIHGHFENTAILKILRNLAHNFLSQQWKNPDGVLEKGLAFNQSIDRLAGIYFISNEILALKNLTLQLTTEIKILKSRNDTLHSFKCINKGNFPILYRNLGTALHETIKSRLNKNLANTEHLELWKDVATILKYMADIAKTLETRNNLSAFFKKSIPVLKLFLSQGIPIIDLQFKNETQEVLEILKTLQQSTRFLQSLCCHSRLKKDTTLMSKVPYVRQLLETLIYKVKAVLAANNCSEAFWMGNLKNKNIHGEVIATQQSIESEESVEDSDEQLPEDVDSDDSEGEMIDPDSKSVSDIV